MDDVISFLKNLDVYEDDNVVLACSYGPDSMVLLDILKKMNFNVIVAHVNHKLRRESEQEFNDLKKYCDDNDIIFEGTFIDSYPKGNVEAFAREFRYHFFEEVINKYKGKYLFTAHHGDDLVETVLMRIARGASLNGYSGFRLITKCTGYSIVRPLIYLTKEDIMEYAKDNNINYAIDMSNFEDIYMRNKYRHKILPILKEINPKIHNKFIKFSNNIVECVDYIDNEVNKIFSEVYKDSRIDLNIFSLYDAFIQKKVLQKALGIQYKNKINRITNKHIDLVFDLIHSEKVNCHVNLPENVTVCKFYNILIIDYKDDYKDYEYIFNDELKLNDWVLKRVENTDIEKSNYIFRLNLSSIKMPLYVRNRKPGDKIILRNGTKKVGQIFSESKIAKNERDAWPLLCDNEGKILWIPGVKKSKFDSKYNEDYDIIVKYIKKGEKNEK